MLQLLLQEAAASAASSSISDCQGLGRRFLLRSKRLCEEADALEPHQCYQSWGGTQFWDPGQQYGCKTRMDSPVLVSVHGSRFLWFSPGWLPYPLSWVAWCAPAGVHPGRHGGEDPFLFISVLRRAGSTLVQRFEFQAVSWKMSACSAKPPLDPSFTAQHLPPLSLLFSPSWPGVESP